MKKLALLLSIFGVLISAFTAVKAQENTEKLDSIIVQKYENGRPQFYAKEEMKYTALGGILQHIQFTRTPDKQGWLPVEKRDYEYDGAGTKELQLKSIWNPVDESWIATSKTQYQFDDEGRATETSHYLYESFTKKWWLYSVEKRSYNQSDLSKIETEYWSSDYPVYKTIEEYFYLENSEIDMVLTSSTLLGTLKRSAKDKYTYAESGELMQIDHFKYNLVLAGFQLVNQSKLNFDQNGNISEIHEFVFDNSKVLSGINRKILSYDMKQSMQGICTHDDQILNIPFDKKIQAIQYAVDVKGNGEYKNTFTELFFYSKNTLAGINKQIQSPISLFPNPASNRLTIASEETSFENYSVYTMQGSEVQKGSFDLSTNQIDISNLLAGNYIIRLEGTSASGQARFVKQ